MQHDKRLEKKLKQLKEAYDNQPQMTDSKRIVSNIFHEQRAHIGGKRKLLPVITTVAVITIVGVLFIATPEFFQSQQDDTHFNDSAHDQGKQEVALQENETFIKEEAFVVQRPDFITESLDIEGMPEEMTFHLATHEQLRISTYYSDEFVIVTAEDSISFFANFDGEKHEATYVEIYAMDVMDVIQQRKELVFNLFKDYVVTEKQKDEFIIPFSEQEYRLEKGELVGTVSLFEHNEKLFRITLHYPEEYGDGFMPRANKIISELHFH